MDFTQIIRILGLLSFPNCRRINGFRIFSDGSGFQRYKVRVWFLWRSSLSIIFIWIDDFMNGFILVLAFLLLRLTCLWPFVTDYSFCCLAFPWHLDLLPFWWHSSKVYLSFFGETKGTLCSCFQCCECCSIKCMSVFLLFCFHEIIMQA